MTIGVRVAFQSAMRTASVALLTDYAAAASIGLQVYRARPRSLRPPSAFVDLIRESLSYDTNIRQRTAQSDVIVVHGLFDSGDAADQKDAFVDDFIEWVGDRYYAAAANTTIAVVETEDIPAYVPDWLIPEQGQRTYYASRLTLEGFAGG